MPGLFDDVAEAAPSGAVDLFADVPAVAEANTLQGIGRSFTRAAKGTAQAFDVRELGNTIEQIRNTITGAADWPPPPGVTPPDVAITGRGIEVGGALRPQRGARGNSPLQLEDAVRQHPRVQALARQIADRELELAGLRGSQAAEAWDQAQGMAAVQTFARDPVEITANIVAKGLWGSLPGILSGMVLGAAGGPAGLALGTGAGSFSVEYANTILEGLRATGADLSDPEQVVAGVSDPERLREWRAHALKRGVPVAVFDAASGALAGKFLKAAGGGAQALAKAGGKEAALQAGLGAAGEASAQGVSGETLRLKDIFEEAVGEIGPGAVETVVNVARARFLAKPRKAEGEDTLFADVPDSKEKEIEAAKAELEQAAKELQTAPAAAAAGEEEEATPAGGGVDLRRAVIEQVGPQDPGTGVPAKAPRAQETAAEATATTAPAAPAWQLTREEYAGQSPFAATQISRGREHGRLVEEALRRGEPVPDAVKAEYPEVVARMNAEAQRRADAEKKQTEAAEKAAQRKPGRRPAVEPREDGVFDVLDAIQELGGIAAPSQSKFAGEGDYDGYDEAFAYGAARLLRRTAGGLRPDELRDALANNYGFKLESVSDLYEAVSRAAEARAAIRKGNAKLDEQTLERMYAAAAVEGEEAATQEADTVDMEVTGPIEFLESLKADMKPGDLHALGLLPATWNALIDIAITAVKGGMALADAIVWAINQLRKRGEIGPEVDELELAAELMDRVEIAAGQRPEVIARIDRPGEADVSKPGEISAAKPKPKARVAGDRTRRRASTAGSRRKAEAEPQPEAEVSPARGTGEPGAVATIQPDRPRPATLMEEVRQRIADLEGERKQWMVSVRNYAGNDPVHAFPTGTAAMYQARLIDGQLDALDELASFLKRTGLGQKINAPSQLMLAIDAGEPFPTPAKKKAGGDVSVMEDLAARIAELREESQRLAFNARLYAGDIPGRATPSGISLMARAQYVDGMLYGLEAVRELFQANGITERIENAKRDVKRAWTDYYGYTRSKLFLGPDPEAIVKAFAYYKALAKLAALYAAKGVADAATFAKAVGVKLNGIVQAAWDDAIAGRIKDRGGELDPAAVDELAKEMRERKFSARYDEDERIKAAIRHATQNREYIVLPNKLTMAEALTAIEQLGIDGARAELMNEQNGWDARVRVTIGQALLHKLNAAYKKTRDDAAVGKAVDVAEWLTEYGTRLGQGVQAFAIWGRMTPEGYVAMYKRAIKRAAKAAEKKEEKTKEGKEEKPKLKLPEYDPKVAEEVHKRAAAALDKPEGWQRDEAIADVLAFIAQQKGLNKWDIGIALWYANILSGWTTQLRNAAGNLGQLLAESAAHMAAYPGRVPDILAAMYVGIIRGGWDAANVVRTGKVTGTRLEKYEVPRVLELKRFGGLAYPLNAWKYVWRVMAGADMLFFRSAEELRARMLARTLAIEQGLKGEALGRAMAAILHEAPAQVAAAEAQAKSEGHKGLNYRRRVWDLIEQGRPESLVEEAAEYGRFATFNNRPVGVLGTLARKISEASNERKYLKLIVPFTHIVANVGNASLNYSPWGYVRLFVPGLRNEFMPDASPMNYRLQAARATLGTLGLTAIWALAAGMMDDEDPWFDLTALGPVDPGRRNQLRETGWRPYAVKIGGRWINYQNTPLHLGLAFLGNMMDAVRYRKLAEADLWNRAYYALTQVKDTLLSQSFLTGLAEFFDSGGARAVPKTGAAQFGGLARTASSIVIPNLVKQVDRLFDPTVYDASTIEAALMRDIPIARRGLAPALNVLGEPVRAEVNPFVSGRREDELWHLLASKQAWISVPEKTMLIRDRMITPEEYARFVQTSGPPIRKRIEANARLIQLLPPEGAQDFVERIVREERAIAKRKLFGGG
jgi:hypothetical protein